MKKIILHVGMPKTGTTSIQKFLFDSRKSNFLPRLDYHLPIQDNMHSQHFLWGLFRDVSDMPRWPKFAIERLGGINEIKENLESCWLNIENSQRAVFSSEYLVTWSAEELFSLKKRLEKAGFIDISVLLYVRNPVRFYLSVVQQQIKADSTFPSPYSFKTHYCSILKKISSVFGPVELRSFERADLHEGCVIQDFMLNLENLLEIQPCYADIKPVQVNTSLSAEAMVFLQKWNKARKNDGNIGSNSSKVVAALHRSQTVILQTPPELKPSVKRLISVNCKRDLAELEAWGIEFKLSKIDHDDNASESSEDYSDVPRLLTTYNQSALADLENYMEEFRIQ